ncbi:MAG: exosortase U [Planctomycetaceae bacterium]
MSTATAIAPIKENRPLLLLLIGVALGTLPMFISHLANMWRQPQYQYFPIVLLVIAWLIRRGAKWRPNPLQRTWHHTLGLIIVAGALAVSALGTWVMSPWVATVGMVLAFGGCLMLLWRWLHLDNPIGIWCLSLLVLRPPLGLDTKLAFWLQGITTRVSGALLDMIGVVNLIEGNTLVLESRHLFVEEACSGIVSLMSIIACCAIIAVWQDRPAPHAILLTLSGAFWAAILNTFRITIMAFALDSFGLDMTEGWKHEALGLALFAGTLGLTFCTDRLLLFFLAPVEHPDSEMYGAYEVDVAEPLLSRIWNTLVEPRRLFSPPVHSDSGVGASKPYVPTWTMAVAALFLCLGVTQVVRGAISKQDFQRIAPSDAILQVGSTAMPADFNGQKLKGFETVRRDVLDEFGEQSHQWQYDLSGVSVLYSMDFVFSEWHELTLCYKGLGWQMVERRLYVDPATDREFMRAIFKKGPDRAMVVFGNFDSEGRHANPPETSLIASFLNRLQGTPGGVYQTQAFFVIPQDIPKELRNRVTKNYTEFHDRMSKLQRKN